MDSGLKVAFGLGIGAIFICWIITLFCYVPPPRRGLFFLPCGPNRTTPPGCPRRLCPIIHLVGRHSQNQIMPACPAFPQRPQIRKAPVVGGKQVVQQTQFRICAVP